MVQDPRRHLSCIMFTDMVGYSALAQRDERLALELVADQRTLLRPIFAAHHGTVVKSTGDGFLVEFASALDGVRCAVEAQRVLAERNDSLPPDRRLLVRIGLHLGDVEVQDGDVFGDGVNVAARIQQAAPAAGIAVSGTVADAVKHRLEHPFAPLGPRRLKNIAEPVDLFRVVLPWEPRRGRLRLPPLARAGRRRFALTAIAVIVLAGLVWAWSRGQAPQGAGEVRSLAVLPLADDSPDPSDDYFADGMTEALIAGLSRIRSLKVISRTSAMQYRNSDKRLPDIARELDVDAILEGSVVRAGNRVRISVRLVRAATEEGLWSETYERDLSDILALQADVAGSVATEVRAELTQDERVRLARSRPVAPAAYEAYLRGRYWWNTRTREGLEQALGHFRTAIEIDPTWASGYAGLADVYQTLGFNGYASPSDVYPKARAAAMRAIELDEGSAEAHQVLSGVLLNYYWDWERSGRESRRALELDPNYARGWQTYAFWFVTLGRMEEALEAIRKARELDPLSPRINANVGYFLYFAREYDAARRDANRTLDMEPLLSLFTLGSVSVQQARLEDAVAAFEELARRGDPRARACLASVHVLRGNRAEATRILAELEGEEQIVDPMGIALVHAALGDRDWTFRWLDQAHEERALQPYQLVADPWWDPLRDDPRFADLLRRIKLTPPPPGQRSPGT